MKEERTFLADRYYRLLLEKLRLPNSGCENWLINALELLIEHASEFPPPDDEESYVVEYIYPH